MLLKVDKIIFQSDSERTIPQRPWSGLRGIITLSAWDWIDTECHGNGSCSNACSQALPKESPRLLKKDCTWKIWLMTDGLDYLCPNEVQKGINLPPITERKASAFLKLKTTGTVVSFCPERACGHYAASEMVRRGSRRFQLRRRGKLSPQKKVQKNSSNLKRSY